MNTLTAGIRREQCGPCNCGVDFDDPCAICPNGKWGQYERCVDGKPVSPQRKLVRNVVSFGQAAVKETVAVARGVPAIPLHEQRSRLELCRACTDGNGKVLVDDHCMMCGCYMPRKTKWRSTTCPLGKW